MATLLQPFLPQTLFHMKGLSMISFQLRHTEAQHNAHLRPAIENIYKDMDKGNYHALGVCQEFRLNYSALWTVRHTLVDTSTGSSDIGSSPSR